MHVCDDVQREEVALFHCEAQQATKAVLPAFGCSQQRQNTRQPCGVFYLMIPLHIM